MASRKISELTALTAPASADVLPIVDVSEASPENQNKKITYAELLSSAPAGTAAAPAFAFDGDSDTGIYASAANELSVTTGGTERLRIDATGQIEAVSLGTAAAPTYTFTGDPNSGLYSPGADQVAISTGGTGRLFIRADGGVAVNTAVSPLDVGMQFAVGGPIGLLPYTQNVVGTSNVTFRSSLGSASNEDFIKHEITNINNGANYGTALSFSTRTSTAALERLRITSAGNVGIGTVSPAYGLEVNNQNIAITNRPSTGTGNPVLYLRRNVESGDAGAVATHGSLVFQTDYAANGVFATSSSILVGSTTGDSVNTYFAFSTTNSGGTLGERLRIDGSGRVGIGSTNPSAPLEIRSDSAGSVASLLKLNNNAAIASGKGVRIDFGLSDTSTASARGYIENVLDGSNGTYMAFGVNDGSTGTFEAVRIDRNRRLLVGTSSAPSYSGGSPGFSVNGTGNDSFIAAARYNSANAFGPDIAFLRSRSGTVGTQTRVQSGDVLGSLSYLGSDDTAFIPGARIIGEVDGTPGVNDMPGRLLFLTTPDGAASPTERMRITSDAYVRLASGTGGIQFNGDTAAANALDDYEEGTWTPTITDGTNSATLTTVFGTYTKVGRQVTASCYVVVNSIGSVGSVRVASLPFAIAGGSQFSAAVNVGFAASLNITANQVVTGRTATGFSHLIMSVWTATTGVTDLTGTQLSDGGELALTVTYFT